MELSMQRYLKTSGRVTPSFLFFTFLIFLWSCHNENSNASNGPVKKVSVQVSGTPSVVAEVKGIKITNAELEKGIESDLFEARMKVYEIQRERLKGLILEKLMESDPKKMGLSNDQYLEKYILKGKGNPTESDIKAFIKERNIPATQVNDHTKDRIKKFLGHLKKKELIDEWLESSQKSGLISVVLPKPKRPVFKLETGKAPFQGDKNAKVTLVEFSDFQCPFCAKGATLIKQIKKKYGDKVKVVFKNFPLPFHKHAQVAAEASLCANEQGQKLFWKLHDHMFENQNLLKKEDLINSAGKLGLKKGPFQKCLEAGRYTAQVKADMEDGKAVGVKSTPTFFVNGKMVTGAQPIKVFTDLTDEDL